jgi:hypothetical protein
MLSRLLHNNQISANINNGYIIFFISVSPEKKERGKAKARKKLIVKEREITVTMKRTIFWVAMPRTRILEKTNISEEHRASIFRDKVYIFKY